MSSSLPFIEKYSPKKLDDILDNEISVKRLKTMIQKKEIQVNK